MKKTLLSFALAALSCASISAQEAAAPAAEQVPASKWKRGLFTSLTFNQISLKNWAAGGKNSFSGTWIGNAYANYKSEMATWDNTLEMGYGVMRYKGEDYQKSEDKIHISSIYGYDATRQKLFYSGLFDFKSQFGKGYKYGADTTVVSKCMSPGYISISAGMLYKPNDKLSVYLSPIAGRFTIVGDTVLSTTYGVEANEHVRSEFGATAKVTYNHPNIVKNVDYYFRGDFFANWKDHPEHIDVDIETGLNFKVNDWLTALIKVNLLFDDDIKYKEDYTDEDGNPAVRIRGARLQCKELLGFGLSFKIDK
ncbi:MAG: DUF3078 domain-containing protein [Bacteroidales bacterium]|nr:DUF3078 domain-containing protein [Bacteroidales bacterium]